MNFKHRFLLTSLFTSCFLFTNCGKDEEKSSAEEKIKLSPKSQLEEMDGFKFFIGTAFVQGRMLSFPKPKEREPDETDVEIAKQIRQILEKEQEVIFRTDNNTWVLQFDKRGQLSRGRRMEYKGLQDIDFSECPVVIIQILKYDSTESDRLNGVDWKADILFQRQTNRHISYDYSSKKYTSTKWRTPQSYSSIFYKWKATVSNGKLSLKGGDIGSNLMKIDHKVMEKALFDIAN